MPTIDEIKNKALEEIRGLGGRRVGATSPVVGPAEQDLSVRKGRLGKIYTDTVRQLKDIGGAEAEAAIEEVSKAARELRATMPPPRRCEPYPPPKETDN